MALAVYAGFFLNFIISKSACNILFLVEMP